MKSWLRHKRGVSVSVEFNRGFVRLYFGKFTQIEFRRRKDKRSLEHFSVKENFTIKGLLCLPDPVFLLRGHPCQHYQDHFQNLRRKKKMKRSLSRS